MRATFAILAMLTSGPLARADETSVCGRPAAGKTFDGIPAFHRCSGKYDGNIYSTDGVSTNIDHRGVLTDTAGYQCVELAGRYTHFRWHKDLWQVEPASDFCHPKPNPFPGVSVHLISREPGYRAHPGDLMVWPQTPRNGNYGHVAVVDAVDANGRVTRVVQQNVGANTGNAPPDGGALCFVHLDSASSPSPPAPPPPAPPPPAPPAEGGWNCNHSAYDGRQIWTCDKGHDRRYRCVNGAAQSEPCAHGCVSHQLGVDDVCAGAPPPPAPPARINWDCNRSSWRGRQLWTCDAARDARCRCEGGVPEKQPCANGCVANRVGFDDVCSAARGRY